MTTHSQKASELFESGLQCAQAVLVSLRDVTGLDEATSLSLAASFGGGISRIREVCGALCGMFIALGIHFGRISRDDPAFAQSKDRHYRLTQYAAAQFKHKVGSIYCYKLLNLPHAAQLPVSDPRTAAYYHNRACGDYAAAAAEVFDELLLAEEKGTLESLITPEQAALTTEYLNQHD